MIQGIDKWDQNWVSGRVIKRGFIGHEGRRKGPGGDESGGNQISFPANRS